MEGEPKSVEEQLAEVMAKEAQAAKELGEMQMEGGHEESVMSAKLSEVQNLTGERVRLENLVSGSK
jgi:hypothetical protein